MVTQNLSEEGLNLQDKSKALDVRRDNLSFLWKNEKEGKEFVCHIPLRQITLLVLLILLFTLGPGILEDASEFIRNLVANREAVVVAAVIFMILALIFSGMLRDLSLSALAIATIIYLAYGAEALRENIESIKKAESIAPLIQDMQAEQEEKKEHSSVAP